MTEVESTVENEESLPNPQQVLQVLRLEILVAKRDERVVTRKQRDYPWNTIGEFLAKSRVDGRPLCCGSVVTPVFELLLQTQLFQLFNGHEHEHLKVLDSIPNRDANGFTAVDFQQFLYEMAAATSYEIDRTKRTSVERIDFHKQSILSLELNLGKLWPDTKFYIMLRPYIFPQSFSANPYRAGSLLIKTKPYHSGLFYQFKWRPIFA